MEDKEYIWAISLNNLIELYDLDAHAKYGFGVNQMLGTYSYTPHISSFLEIDNNYFLGLKGINEGKNTFLLYKLNYSLNDNEITTRATSISYQSTNSKIVSCYKTVLKYIICFYQNSFKFYYANAYDQNLGFVTYTDIFDESEDENAFFKCAHYYEEVGIFGYFNSENLFTFKFMLLQNKTFQNYYTQRETLVLNLDLFDSYKMNDIIKLDDKKICFLSSNNYDILYIVIINDYNEGKIKIRYYEINMNNLYLCTLKDLLKMSLYNDFIALAFNYNKITLDGYEESSSLLLLSYPNSKDFEIDITQYFTTPINNIIIDLNSKCNIDNNIFGLIPIGIKIINFDDIFTLLSLKSYNTISIGELIDTDENITLLVNGINNFPIIGKIEYAMIITEPEYNIYNRYVNKVEYNGDGEDDENNGYFIRKNYTGKHSYCNIKLNTNELTNHCQEPNCKLCYGSNTDICIFESTNIETTIIQNAVLETTNIYTTFIATTIMETTIIETTTPEITIIETSIPLTTYIEKPSIFIEQDTYNIYSTLPKTTNFEITNIITTNIKSTHIETNYIESSLIDKNTNENLSPKQQLF